MAIKGKRKSGRQSAIRSITVSPRLVKADEKITATVIGIPNQRARFFIAHIYGAAHVPMSEDQDQPGTYNGSYVAQWGDNIKNAPLMVELISEDGLIIDQKVGPKVTIDTIPPRITGIKLSRETIRNGQELTINVTSESGCIVTADISEVDATQSKIIIFNKAGRGSTYIKRIRISADNKVKNGPKNIAVTATDVAGNDSEPGVCHIELRNSELLTIHALKKRDAEKLNNAGAITLADLRHIDVKKLSRKSGLSRKKLEQVRAAALLQATGIDANVAYTLVQAGEILSPIQLAFASREKIEQILENGVEEGIINEVLIADDFLVGQLLAIGKGMLVEYENAALADAKLYERTCQTECPGESSVFGCRPYLFELVRISEMSWNELKQKFKQDFLSVNDSPARRTDISIQVLEEAIHDDLGNPPRIPSDWQEYDETLNRYLVKVLVDTTGKSEIALAKKYLNLFDVNRPLADRNADFEITLKNLRRRRPYYLHLIVQFKKRTGKTEEELKAAHPDAFPPAKIIKRNDILEKLLGISSLSVKVEKLRKSLTGLKLDALVKQSGKAESWLSRKYYITFSSKACSATTTCRQAVLTLQEYLSQKSFTNSKFEYQTYDEWHIKQGKNYYPENVCSHEFKIPLIRGNRQLLKKHLEQARKILDSVRVSDDGNRPQEEDLLSSFRWKNPYYTNFKAGLDLIQEGYDVDDLMVKGHQAYANEEHQQARQHYLEAAEKIRVTSKKVSKSMTLLPLWAPNEKDCYFRRDLNEFEKCAMDFLIHTLLSYTNKNEPGVELARGQVGLKGIENGTFKPMFIEGVGKKYEDYSSKFNEFGWKAIGGWKILNPDENKPNLIEEGTLSPSHYKDNLLIYVEEQYWKDIKVQIEISATQDINTGIAFRHRSTNKSHGFVVSMKGNEKKAHQVAGMLKNMQVEPSLPIREFTYSLNVHYLLVVEVKGKNVDAKFWKIQNGIKNPDGEISLKNVAMPESGCIALYSAKCPPSFIKFHNLYVWDLDPAKGSVSDLAFFLNFKRSFDTHNPLMLFFAYLGRGSTPVDNNKLCSYLEKLPKMVSIPYDESDSIIESHITNRDFFDSFYQEADRQSEESGIEKKVNILLNGLWYGQGDDRLHRENLRRILDGLPMLFCHQYFFLLPICLGDVANAQGQYEEALQWYRMVYDERRPMEKRGVYPYLNKEIEGEMMRVKTARNYLDWADSLFNQNTEESLNQARFGYRQALHTMGTELCCDKERHQIAIVQDLGQNLMASNMGAAAMSQIYHTVSELLNKPGKYDQASGLIKGVHRIITSDETSENKALQVNSLLAEKVDTIKPHPPLSSIVDEEKTVHERLDAMVSEYPDVLDRIAENIRLNTGLSQRPTPDNLGVTPQLGTAPNTFPVPYEVYKNTSFYEMYKKVGPFIGLSGNLIPDLPDWFSSFTAIGDCLVYEDIPFSYFLWLYSNRCVPKNPVFNALTKRACLGIYFIDNCFNVLGFSKNDLAIYRFEYLISMAKNFAQMAQTTEKDFMQFKDQFEKETFEIMSASQAAAISQVGVQLAQLRVNESLNHIASANLGFEKVNANITLTQKRIDELGSGWSLFGIVFGAIVSAVGTIATAGAGAPAFVTVGAAIAGIGATGAGAANYMAGKEENEENLRMQLQLLKTVEYNAARQNLKNAIDAEQTARWQARITELEAQYAAEKAQYLTTQFFNPQLWSFLASEVKKNYRTYLSYGTIAAWLAQRALEFERGIEPHRRFAATGPDEAGSGFNIIRFDYFQPSLQGLLGSDNLLKDIATLENEKFLNDQRKNKITKVISLAATRPFLFAHFLETGLLPFSTVLDEFDQDFQGHYQRRISNVRINLFGLIGPEGIKATLTCLGASQVVVREFVEEDGRMQPQFVEKTLRRAPESVALTSPQGGDVGQMALSPQGVILNPFEGQGVAAQWVFEMPEYSNKIDYNTITDIQLLIDYSALDDMDYRKEVIKRLPVTQSGLRPYSFCAEFSDACFHLKDNTRPLGMIETADGTTGAYTLKLETRDTDFPPNQKNRRLKEVIVYFRSKDETDYSDLEVRLACGQQLDALQQSESDLTPGLLIPAEIPTGNDKDGNNFLGKWPADKFVKNGDLHVPGTWYLYISPEPPNPAFSNKTFIKKGANNQPVIINGHKIFDFSSVQDVIFALHYEYDLQKPIP